PAQEQQSGRNTQLAATLAESDTSDLVTEVHIPNDPNGVIPKDHPALSILGNSSLVIQRQLEMMNVMLGFEQANRYIIMDGQGQTLGYIAEQDHGIGSAMVRQLARTHRSFTTHIFDAQEREVLRIHRPFTYINSRIRVYDPVPEGGYADTDTSTALQGVSASSAMNQGAVAQISPYKLTEMCIIGEAQQQWAPLRRKYNLFTYRALEPSPEQSTTQRLESGDRPNTETTALTESNAPDRAIEAGMSQFAHVNEPFLSWDFTLRDEEQSTIGSVNRNFVGFAREIFTDTGVYALRMDSAAQTSALQSADGQEIERYQRDATAMTLDQRAVMLATAVSIDFDYFSRHSHAGGHGFMPIFWPMGGGAAAEGGAAGAGAGAGAAGGAAAEGAAGVGIAEGAAGAATGAASRGLGTGAGAAAESGIAGAGTMAGYEAMQRGVYGSGGRAADDASPQANEPFQNPQSQEQMENRPGNDEVWGENQDPWGGGGPGDPPSPGAGGGGGGEGGGG
ncbi:Scramblase-domain-containing protein, partial [Neohortaea acidophila]